ncbi:ABC transporter permease [Alkalilacustris brevis]|uniref:ABC transporter permease n=1 Tax=Alkalilacustris brevis TaxID=2026338 RepID=UPI000E0D1032|nr:ABC transporter permease [Alkalilacustris brevis]
MNIQLPPARPRRRYRSLRSIGALMLREMSTSYGAAPGGYVWALLVPIGGVLLLSFVFSLLLRAPSLGTSFPLFKATGLLIFMMWHDVSNAVAGAIRHSRQLLFYPAVKYIDAILARFVLNALTGVVVFCIVIAGVLLIFDLRPVIRLGPVVLAFAMAGALALGFGTLNCYLFTAFPLWERVWMIATRPLLIVSGVLFLYEDAPRSLQQFLWFNPLMHVTGEMRRGFYAYYDPGYVAPAFIFALSLIALVAGLILLRKHHMRLLNNL